jgi:hypothetical protein
LQGRVGRGPDLGDIRDALRKEGYSAAEVMGSLGGKSIAQQPRALCRAARTTT